MKKIKNQTLFQRSLSTFLAAWRRTFGPRRTAANLSLFPSHNQFRILLALITVAVACLFIWLDADLIRWKREAIPRESLTVSMFELITLSGTSGWILIITAIIGVYLSTSDWAALPRSDRSRRLNIYADANFVFFTVAISGIAANLIKNSIGRARPRLLEELGPHHFNHAAFDSKFASFPSGHSTTSGALSMALILLFPRYWPVWLIFGILGGLSRFVVDAHYPADVLAGLTFGAGFVIFAARWLALRGTMFRLSDSWIPTRRRHPY